MKSYKTLIIIISFLLVTLMATNPPTAEHKEAVKEKVSTVFENNKSEGNVFQKLGEQLGQTIGMVLIDKMIKRENYLLFSLTKSRFLDNDEKEKVIGFGILGKVYLSNAFSENIVEKFEESQKPKESLNYIIGNLEIMKKDLEGTMYLPDAEKIATDKGDGWRVPNIEELKLLYKNRYEIGGFNNDRNIDNTNYMSSTEAYGDGVYRDIIVLSFIDGEIGYDFYAKGGGQKVRLIRTIKN
jgi:hypothetical protein